MSKEAIKHYEAALKEAFPRGATGEVFHHWNEARYLIATEALDKMAENAKELGLDYEPAQPYKSLADYPRYWIDPVTGNVGIGTPSTPAQRPWQGLTDEEIEQGCKESWVTEQAWQSAVWWAEAKLRSKNT